MLEIETRNGPTLMKGIGNPDKNSLGEMAWEKTDWSELKREMNKHE